MKVTVDKKQGLLGITFDHPEEQRRLGEQILEAYSKCQAWPAAVCIPMDKTSTSEDHTRFLAKILGKEVD